MAGFLKAEPKQASVKMSAYGPPGSGKTFSTLLFAEGLARHTGKRIAFVDTERGTDFYAMNVPARQPHPDSFDFDAIYTRSLTEVLSDCKKLNFNEHGIIVIDSISHLWDTAMASYTGPKTKAGTIPMYAWTTIKRPYKELMKFLIDSPFHVFILGRQANVFEEDPETGESKAAGVKMRAEGETAYEPHICLRMMPQRTEKRGNKTIIHKEQTIYAFAEKDRTGILSGKMIMEPTFENTIAPLLGLMGTTQAATPNDDDAATQDAEELARQAKDKTQASADLARKYLARMELCDTQALLKEIGAELTPAVKKSFAAADLEAVRSAWLAKDRQLKGLPTNGNGTTTPATVNEDAD